MPRGRDQDLDPFGAHRERLPVPHIFKDNKTVDVERLSDKHVARLVKQTALAAGVRAHIPEGARALLFSGHSLRAGLASSADIEEHYVQSSSAMPRPR